MTDIKRCISPNSLANLNPKARFKGKVRRNTTLMEETISWLEGFGGNVSQGIEDLVAAAKSSTLNTCNNQQLMTNDNIDQRLERLGDELSEFRQHLGENTAAIATLERTTSELLEIARLHQQGLRIAQLRADEDRAEIRRIWEYLLSQQGNGNGGRT